MPDLLPYHVFFALVVALGAWLLLYGVRGLAQKHPATPITPGAPPSADQVDQVSALPQFVRGRWSRPVSALGQRLLGQRDATRLEDRLRRSGWRYGSVGD